MPRHSGLAAAVLRIACLLLSNTKAATKHSTKSRGHVNASKCQGKQQHISRPRLCVCIADVASILTQTSSLQSKMNSKRVEQLCRQVSGLVGLLVEMQGMHSSQGQTRLPVCMRSQRLKQT